MSAFSLFQCIFLFIISCKSLWDFILKALYKIVYYYYSLLGELFLHASCSLFLTFKLQPCWYLDHFVGLNSTLNQSNSRTRTNCCIGMRGIPVMEKYRYLLYFKRYDIIILLISVFHTLLFRSSPLGGSASQIAASPVNLTTEQRDGSNRLNSYQRTWN